MCIRDSLSIDNTVVTGASSQLILMSGEASADITFTLNLDHVTAHDSTFQPVAVSATATTGFTHDYTINAYNSAFVDTGAPITRSGTGTGTNTVVVNGSHNLHTSASTVNGALTDNTTDWVDASAGGITTDPTTANAIIVTDLTAGSENLALVKPTTGDNLALDAGSYATEPDSRQDFSRDIRGRARYATNVDIGAFQLTTAGEGRGEGAVSWPPLWLVHELV